jgi:hypothetical protein
MNRDSSVSEVTRYRIIDCCSIPGTGKDNFLHYYIQVVSGYIQISHRAGATTYLHLVL